MNKKIILLTITLLSGTYITHANLPPDNKTEYYNLDPQLYAETTATITPYSEQKENSQEIRNYYEISYNVTESTAYNKDNKKIEGKITQFVFPDDNSETRPQEIKIKYEKADPIMFHMKN